MPRIKPTSYTFGNEEAPDTRLDVDTIAGASVSLTTIDHYDTVILTEATSVSIGAIRNNDHKLTLISKAVGNLTVSCDAGDNIQTVIESTTSFTCHSPCNMTLVAVDGVWYIESEIGVYEKGNSITEFSNLIVGDNYITLVPFPKKGKLVDITSKFDSDGTMGTWTTLSLVERNSAGTEVRTDYLMTNSTWIEDEINYGTVAPIKHGSYKFNQVITADTVCLFYIYTGKKSTLDTTGWTANIDPTVFLNWLRYT